MSGLDAFLETLNEQPIQPDEFTIKMAYDRHADQGGALTFDAIRNRITRLAENGKLTSRIMTINSTRVRVYRSK